MADPSSSGSGSSVPPSSPLRDLVDSAAREVSVVAGKLEQLYRDSFVGTASGGPVDGVRRGAVVDATDPLGRHRVQVTIGSLGGAPVWAERPLAADGGPPSELAVGTLVWLAFEDGDRALPVVVGRVAG